jgi:elongation factor G
VVSRILDLSSYATAQGFYEALEKGSLSGNPITGCCFVLKDGAFHAVDSSELAFRNATIGAFREAYKSTKPVILEPIMTVEVVAPSEFQSVSHTFLRADEF